MVRYPVSARTQAGGSVMDRFPDDSLRVNECERGGLTKFKLIHAMRFTRQSQSCTAGSRLFLHASIFDEFLEKLVEHTLKLRLGDPLDETTDMGAIINEKQFTKVCGYIEEELGRSDARLVTGGRPPESGPLSEGFFTRPTIFCDASNDWRLAREEIFGPVLVAIRWLVPPRGFLDETPPPPRP